VIVVTHTPLVSAVASYLPTAPKPGGLTVINSAEVIALFVGHNVIGVLQRHTHIDELVMWHDVPYRTSGAVCGN